MRPGQNHGSFFLNPSVFLCKGASKAGVEDASCVSVSLATNIRASRCLPDYLPVAYFSSLCVFSFPAVKTALKMKIGLIFRRGWRVNEGMNDPFGSFLQIRLSRTYQNL